MNRNINLSCIEIEINTKCNFKCSYCPSSFNNVKNSYMSFEKYKIIIDKLKQVDFNGRLSFHFYNEPTLHPDLEKFIKFSSKELPKALLRLYTNGSRLNDKLYCRLSNAGVDQFYVTLHKQTPNLPTRPKQVVRELSNIDITNRGGSLHSINNHLEIPCMLPQEFLLFDINGNALMCFEDYYKTEIFGNIFIDSLEKIYFNTRLEIFRKHLSLGDRTICNICKKCDSKAYQKLGQVYIE
ncbi:MAG: radical SAM/SPASM domain-containing protein [Halarcobacter sp.]